MDILIKDNFFTDPDKIRQFGLNAPYYWSGNVHEKYHRWLGHRTNPEYLRSGEYNVTGEENNYSYKHPFDEEYLQLDKDNSSKINNPIIETIPKHFNFDMKDVRYQCSFHVSDLYNSRLEYFDDVKYHRDALRKNSWAGVIYLTPNPPKKSGTSILDGKNSKIIEVENVYNRLVCYSSRYIHAMTNPFGTNLNTGRMTLTFFFLGEEILKYSHIMR